MLFLSIVVVVVRTWNRTCWRLVCRVRRR